MEKRRFLITMALLLSVFAFFLGADQSIAQTNAKSKALIKSKESVQSQAYSDQSRNFDSALERMKRRMELHQLRKDAAKRFKESRAASASKKEASGEMEGGTNK